MQILYNCLPRFWANNGNTSIVLSSTPAVGGSVCRGVLSEVNG